VISVLNRGEKKKVKPGRPERARKEKKPSGAKKGNVIKDSWSLTTTSCETEGREGINLFGREGGEIPISGEKKRRRYHQLTSREAKIF